jgi:nucleotide-binding universal stress UspA family protein
MGGFANGGKVPTMYHKILIPLDGSRLSELALPHAEALAKQFKSEILLVRQNVSARAGSF